MRVEFHSILNSADWHAALEEMPLECRDVYFMPEYHRMHQANGDGQAMSMIAREERKSLLIMGMRSAIPGPPPGSAAWDLETCNGYGGPIASGDVDEAFLSRAWAEWRGEYAEAGMVAAFFRMHPLLHNNKLLPPDAEVRLERHTVFVDISGGVESVWKHADSRHRNMVNKGLKEGTEVAWNEPADWADFEKLYTDSMQRKDAPGRLCFSPEYFAQLRALPGAEIAAIRRGGSVTAAAVFLWGGLWGHYHLAARSIEAPNYASNCILQAAIERAASRRLQGIHLGGGTTASPDDPLLKFKKSTGGRLLDFQVGLVIVNRAFFDRLCQDWERQAGRKPTWLLGYRQPL